MKTLIKRYSNPKRLCVLNIILLALFIFINVLCPVFGVPVMYAAIIVFVCFGAIGFYPIVENKRGIIFISFINGISFVLFVFCYLFALTDRGNASLWLWTVLCFFYIWPFISVVFIIQLLYKYIVKPVSKTSRLAFICGILICLPIAPMAGFQYKKASVTLQKSATIGYTKIEKNYMVERIMGMHFIYHTKLCIFDGWRPPLQDPFLTIGRWMNGGLDPIKLPLKDRLQLYQSTFPDRPYKFKFANCCAFAQNGYFTDTLWNYALPAAKT